MKAFDQIPPEAIVGEFSDCDALIEQLRQRAEALGLSFRVIDELAGLPENYTGKLLCVTRMKAMTVSSMLALTGALGIKAVLVVDEEMTRRMRPRWEPKDATKARPRASKRLGKTSLARLVPRIAAEMGRRGGARRRELAPEVRSAFARAASRARWGDPIQP
jgi:hypothetical protein